MTIKRLLLYSLTAVCLTQLYASEKTDYIKQLVKKGNDIALTGNMQAGIDMHQQALDWAAENCGQSSFEFAYAYGILAGDMLSAGQADKALEMVMQAEQFYIASGDTSLINKCEINYAKASILTYNGKLEEAEKILNETEEQLKARNEGNSVLYAVILEMHSALFNMRGDSKSSLDYAFKALDCAKDKLYKEKPIDAVNLLQTIGVQYKHMGMYTESAAYFEEAMQLCIEKYGENNIYYGAILNNLSNLYRELGNYPKAIELSKKSISLYERNGTDKSLEYVGALNSLASSYIKTTDFENAKLYANRCIAALENLKGTVNDIYYYIFLSNIGVMFEQIGDYDKALNYYIGAIEGLNKNNFNKHGKNYVTIVHNTSSLYYSQGQYKKAIEYEEEACRLTENKNTIYYAALLSGLGVMYKDYGQLYKALEYMNQAVELAESTAGKEHDLYALCLNNIGSLYAQMYDYDRAAIYTEEALRITEKTVGKDHGECATKLTNLGVIEKERGNYEKALNYLNRAVALSEKVYGSNNNTIAFALNSLAILYNNMGDFVSAADTYNKAIDVYANIFGKENIAYVQERHNLATLYSKRKDTQKTLSIITENKHILNNIPKEDRGTKFYGLYVETLLFESGLIQVENPEKARLLVQQAMEMAEEHFGKLSKEYIHGLNSLSDVSLLLLDPYPVILNQAEATDLARTLYGTQNIEYIKQLTKLVDLQNYIPFTTKNDKNSNAEIIGFLNDNINRNFTYMTERERENYWLQFENIVNTVKKSISRSSDNQGLLYNAALLEKSLLLDATIGVAQKTQETNDSALIKLHEQLRALRVEASILNDDDTTKVSSRVLTAQADSVERLLLKGLEQYHLTGNHIFTWQQIQSVLKKNEAAVEFLHYRHNEKEHYAASVIRQGWKHPRNILLFTRDSLAEKTLASQDAYNNSSAYNIIWKPLIKHLKGATQIYFSPAGILHQVGIEYLQNENGDRMNQLFGMMRLSSTKELAAEHGEETHNNTAAVFGAADFDMDAEDMEFEADIYKRTQSATRSAVDYSEQMQWLEYLPGTETEINVVSELLQDDMHYSTITYSGKSCIEESFKSLSGHSPSVIHIATHGFCLTVPDISFSASSTREDISLLYSGLAFAGANNLLSKSFAAHNIDDGILTSREVAQTDLRKTDMVVLSACQTGLGLLTGEGVFGLQRAFKKAGVRSMLVSLWEVSDLATQLMMTFFYQEIAKGCDYHTALRNAQSRLREQTITLTDGTMQSMDNPLYWAAFVLLD
ncbi:MAG: CHAT domain-containing protein [Paludibacteraceae bacterium]|nr:CHAT domain-containing protein [Paludibacteraceae bacterium]